MPIGNYKLPEQIIIPGQTSSRARFWQRFFFLKTLMQYKQRKPTRCH